ncbi:MAG: hypothetical protein P8Z50_06850, partial [candidate division WOR-3 bacterium]
MSDNKQISNEQFQQLTSLMFNLPYEDEFRKVKVKTKELDAFLEEVAEGRIKDSREFLKEGIERTMTPALLSIIKEKIRRFAEKYEQDAKGKAALMVLSLLYRNFPLESNA